MRSISSEHRTLAFQAGDSDAAPNDAAVSPKSRRRSPNTVGAEILAGERIVTDNAGTVYLYDVNRWRELSEIRVNQMCGRYDGSMETSGHRIAEISRYIKRESLNEFLTWSRVADHEVATTNCVVDVLSGEVRPHSPDDFLERVPPIDYRPGATAPLWNAALATWFGSADSPSAMALQDFFGYSLASHAKYKKALVLKGPGDSGKSVVVYVLQQMAGPGNCCTLGVEHMDDPTRRAVLKGKALNVITELSSGAVVADGGFKTLVSTEEPILIDQKYRPAEIYTPTAKHVIATNVLPRLSDRFEETLSRLLIVPMLRPVAAEQQDENLREKLIEELPGILIWALEGARRLIRRRGQFVAPIEADAVLSEMRDDANPIRTFLDERCVPDIGAAIPLSILAQHFNKWRSGGRPLTVRTIGALARQSGQVVKKVRYHDSIIIALVGWRRNEIETPRDMLISDGDAVSAAEDIDAIDDRPSPI